MNHKYTGMLKQKPHFSLINYNKYIICKYVIKIKTHSFYKRPKHNIYNILDWRQYPIKLFVFQNSY